MKKAKLKYIKRTNNTISKTKLKLLKKGDLVLCWGAGVIFRKEVAIITNKTLYENMVNVVINGTPYYQPIVNIIRKLKKEDYPEYYL